MGQVLCSDVLRFEPVVDRCVQLVEAVAQGSFVRGFGRYNLRQTRRKTRL